MKKALSVCLFFAACLLYASDYKWDLVSALSANDYPVSEKIINDNIKKVPAAEKPLLTNFALTYSYGETTLQVLNLLLKHNVIPSAFDLYTAIGRNQPDSVAYFIMNQGARANGEILLLAMEMKKFDLARQFIQSGADVNYSYPAGKDYADGMTSLLHAAKNNNMELVHLLIDRGAHINTKDKSGNTALSYAQTNSNLQMSEFLLQRGANPNMAYNVPGQSTRQNAQQTGSLGQFLEITAAEFKPGNYRLSKSTLGESRDLRFSGTPSFGIIGYIRNNRAYNGTYQSSNGNVTVIMDGRAFNYKIDSENSITGNGETWIRTGD